MPPSSDDDDTPLGQRLSNPKQSPAQTKKPKVKKPTSESDDDVPLAAKPRPATTTITTKVPSPKVKKPVSTVIRKKRPVKNEASDSDDVPLVRSKSKPSPVKREKPASDSDDDVPLAKKTKKPKVKHETPSKTNGLKPEKKKHMKKEEEEVDDVTPEADDEEYKWWEGNQGDGTKKWSTLEHNGVLFPPPYEPLPNHIKMKYDGKPVGLPPEAEEVAGYFAALIESDHGQNPVFQKNFFQDWLAVLKERNAAPQIQDFEKCDFRPMWEYFEMKKEEKKKMTKDEKAAIKKERDDLEAPYKHCLLDGRKEMVGNFKIEPPGLFRGRGKHPKTGKLKVRKASPFSFVLSS
jgi:DNA topoisomerase I